ncbi:hypothetical protein Xvie_03791 [Xenorhabdus vietnamensis]|uniref:Uncharacterized protein n=1 Tax=Xenorhabdus vietnamensis TaxID=351656 RepID=A0A1Y2S6Q1_9GAMM|nr:hypothetical protein [Xenorhabdus vietnamensis]OTA14330.1 hypothetical protein Xvie_03791 [Xenorhabdus vietnamensis]
MNRFAKVLFSLILVSLPFSGHSFQASDTTTNTYQISPTKIGWFGDSSDLKHFYPSIKDAPNYPVGFKNARNGVTKNTVKKKYLLDKLRKKAPGKWYKIYRDGRVDKKHVSIHYFAHQSGSPVFDVKVVSGWSNPQSS